MTFSKIPSVLIVFISAIVILIYSQNLLMPLIFAALLWFLVRKIKEVADKINFIKTRVPSWVKSLLISVFIFSLLGFMSNTLSSSIASLAQSYGKYEANIGLVTARINSSFNINIMEMLKGHSGELDYGVILGSVFNSLTFILGNAFLIVLYTVFIFLEESYFNYKLKALFTADLQYSRVIVIIEKIEKSITDYIGLKTLVSLITGVLSYIVLVLIGLDSPIFWASLIFLLNFIPTIGSMIGTVFPAIFALLQFGEISPFIMVLVFIGVIQIVIGNILEPKLMGNSLNVSPLVAIISLSFWGAIWGITGMILSIPITVIMVIIFAQFEKTRPVAILLSEKGRL